MEKMEKILVNYVCPSLELICDEIEWEEIPSALDKFEIFCKSLDDIPECEQTEFLADIIIDSFIEQASPILFIYGSSSPKIIKEADKLLLLFQMLL